MSSESLVYAKRRCVVREPKFDLVDSVGWKWFCQKRDTFIRVLYK